MKPEIGSILAMAVFSLITMLVNQFRRWKFERAYETDEKEYTQACEALYASLRTPEPSVGPELCKYLRARLNIEGVFTWSSWGKSVRRFRQWRAALFVVSIIVFVMFAVYLSLAQFAAETGRLVITVLAKVFLVALVGTFTFWLCYLRRCNRLLSERRTHSTGGDLGAPTVEALKKLKPVPCYCLMLIGCLTGAHQSGCVQMPGG